MPILIIISAIVILGAGFYFYKAWQKSDLDDPLNPVQIKKRKEALDKILSLATQKTQITAGDVRAGLGISDDDSARYLDYLVNLNKLTRIASRGQEVVYKIP